MVTATAFPRWLERLAVEEHDLRRFWTVPIGIARFGCEICQVHGVARVATRHQPAGGPPLPPRRVMIPLKIQAPRRLTLNEELLK